MFVAKKLLSDEKVELKVRMDADPLPGAAKERLEFSFQPQVKIGTEWKLGGSTRMYQDDWEREGQIQTVTR